MSSFRFNEYELIPETRRLLLAGDDVAIGARVFETVVYLVQNRDRAIGRDELLSAVWGRVDAGDATLAQAVLKARRALGDDGNAQNYIRTVARYGYQWVAPTTESANCGTHAAPAAEEIAATNADAAAHGDDRTAAHAPIGPAVEAVSPRAARSSRIRLAAGAAAAMAAIAVLAIVVSRFVLAPPAASTARSPVPASASRIVPGLILVTPTRVASASADDGWMRLGVMSLASQALSGVAGHAVVPDETTLAAVAHAGPDSGIEPLRAATGASIVIASEASRVGEDWRLDATVFNADGSAEIVSARARDPVAAATNLAGNLRELLAPEGAGASGETIAPDVLALAARMKAAVLEAQNGRALALMKQAPKAVATAPQIVLIEAEALTQLGKPDEAIAALRPLVDGAAVLSPPPRWLPAAWTALGDSELARGRPADAEAYFRRAIQLEGIADRRSRGMAWRGLGIAQVVRNDLDGAEQSYLRARLELEPVGDRLLLARVTDGLAYIASTRGRIADALILYEQAAEMGAAAGLNETELGSRLNVAQSHHYLLHHAVALEKLRALLPRIQAVDYPALHRFGSIAYAYALIETGAFGEAKAELARLDASSRADAATNAVIDVRLDEAEIDLALGDAASAIRLASAVRADRDPASNPDRPLEAVAVLLSAYLEAGDRKAAEALAADANAWTIPNASAPARVRAHVARARWAAATHDAAGALDHYRQALALARTFGAPLVLRDAAVPYAEFQLAAGAVDVARETASLVGPYAEDDFAVALLMARVAAATRDDALARSYFATARRLAGERWTPSLDAEARLAGLGAEPPSQTASTAAVGG
ncbi:MAG TPA: winged helix-turn-helix domain-containing protein [Rhodanobacteraceae bacterium]|jgi:DNA-binding winged helix-turn-helix (wHTH) protein/tetratricopeptide (TPR) repeat protein|nr:winged helix-turn-helix domain-containing protein [Rhodanobacteraceae bacterium]